MNWRRLATVGFKGDRRTARPRSSSSATSIERVLPALTLPLPPCNHPKARKLSLAQVAVAQTHYHMVRDEDFDRATGIGSAESGAKCGALGAQNTAQQRSATSSEEVCVSPKTEAGPGFLPVPASVFDLSHEATNGPGQTRTVDLTVISGAL
tara:strand:+ start:85072 stop:85527 length:456 start_codon:yes stop_codon:yes gene_type:complete